MADKNTELKSNVKDIAKTVLVLLIIACVSGGLLGCINAITYMSDEEILQKKISKFYEAESFINLQTTEDTEYANLNAKVKALNETEKKGFDTTALLPVKNGAVEQGKVVYRVYGSGDYDCTLLILITNNKIEQVAVYSSSATPGIGDKAYKPAHIDKYKNIDILNVDASKLAVAKKPTNSNEIESVAGATKSSTAVNNAIVTAIKLHQSLFKEG